MVGNGFDLQHDLQTRYNDFLDFMILYLYKKNESNHGPLRLDNPELWENDRNILLFVWQKACQNSAVKELYETYSEKIMESLSRCGKIADCSKNVWLRYCLYTYSYKLSFEKEFRWIDIENEILDLIMKVDSRFDSEKKLIQKNYASISKHHFFVEIPCWMGGKADTMNFYIPFVESVIENPDIPEEFTKRKMFTQLFEELEEFSKYLKFYLSLVMEHFNQKKVFKINHPDGGINVDCILSFNYTNTTGIYAPGVPKHYINGSLGGSSPIILGIENPSLQETERYCESNIHLFFKNVQRILYDYMYDYSEWIIAKPSTTVKNKKRKNIPFKKNVYIIGHSLAISDKQILRDVMMNADKVTIYHRGSDKQDKITNLYRLLEDDYFFHHVGHPVSTPYIILANQEEILF